MTREVAIKGLKAFRKEFSGYEPNEEMFDMAIKALEQEPKSEWQQDHEILKAYSDGANEVLDKIRAEIERQEKWLMVAGYNQYNVDIALDAIKLVVDKYKAETEAEGRNVD